MFEHGEVKQFSFDVDINKSEDRYCNAIYIKPNQELSGMTAPIHVGTPANTEGCSGGRCNYCKVGGYACGTPEPTNHVHLHPQH